MSKQTKADFLQKYGVIRRTLTNWFKPFWNEEPQPKELGITGKSLIIDGKYVEKFATVLVASTPQKLISWHFTQREITVAG